MQGPKTGKSAGGARRPARRQVRMANDWQTTRRRPPAFRPLTRAAGTVPDGVGRCRACCGDAEHGERDDDLANAAAVHGLAPCGGLVPPVHVGGMPDRRQYRFVCIPIRKPNGRHAGGRSARRRQTIGKETYGSGSKCKNSFIYLFTKAPAESAPVRAGKSCECPLDARGFCYTRGPVRRPCPPGGRKPVPVPIRGPIRRPVRGPVPGFRGRTRPESVGRIP